PPPLVMVEPVMVTSSPTWTPPPWPFTTEPSTDARPPTPARTACPPLLVISEAVTVALVPAPTPPAAPVTDEPSATTPGPAELDTVESVTVTSWAAFAATAGELIVEPVTVRLVPPPKLTTPVPLVAV